MKLKKIAYTIIVLMLALSVIAASNVMEIKKGQTVDFYKGRAGVSFTNSQFNGTVKLSRQSSGNAPGEERPKFTQRLFDVRLTDSQGIRITHVVGPVYVYFKIRNKELKMWQNGELSIYYFDTWKQSWQECSYVFLVNQGKSQRLACRIRIFGLYGIGKK